MKLGKVFANAVVRRLAFVLVAAALAWLGLGDARADGHATMAEAYTHAQSDQPLAAGQCAMQRGFRITGFNYGFNSQIECAVYGSNPVTYYWSTFREHLYPASAACAADEVWDAATLTCVNGAERCKAKNAIVPDTSTFAGAFGTCVDGCMIGEREPNSTGSVQVDQQSTKINFGKIGFTGETCSGSVELPNFDTGKTCMPAGGGMTVCATPDGRHCYSTKATVTTLTDDAICWQPGETGTKSKGPVTQTRGPGTTAPTSPPPPDGESHAPGPGNPVTTSTTKPGSPSITTTTTNVTNINGTNGPNQQTGDGSGEGEGDGDKPGDAGEGLGDFYDGEDKTIGDVYGEFKTNMQNAPLVNAAGSFFSGCSGGGSCPQETWTVDDWGIMEDLSALCSGTLPTLIEWGGWVVLALAAFAAFKMAFL